MNQDKIKELAAKYIELETQYQLAGIELQENSIEGDDPDTFYTFDTVEKLLECQKAFSTFQGFYLALEMVGILDNENFEKELNLLYEPYSNSNSQKEDA